jgi:hypothetical protein
MAFFQSLPVDVKVLLGLFVVVGLVAFFTHNHKTEKYYLVALVLLGAGGFYRYQSTKPVENTVAVEEPRPQMTPTPVRKPLQSTSAN